MTSLTDGDYRRVAIETWLIGAAIWLAFLGLLFVFGAPLPMLVGAFIGGQTGVTLIVLLDYRRRHRGLKRTEAKRLVRLMDEEIARLETQYKITVRRP